MIESFCRLPAFLRVFWSLQLALRAFPGGHAGSLATPWRTRGAYGGGRRPESADAAPLWTPGLRRAYRRPAGARD